MGQYIDGRYIYSMDDCRCEDCLHFYRKTKSCRLPECCCLEEKRMAPLFFPPDGYEQKKGGARCRG